MHCRAHVVTLLPIVCRRDLEHQTFQRSQDEGQEADQGQDQDHQAVESFMQVPQTHPRLQCGLRSMLPVECF
jgi:hypothetical protein